MESLFHQLNNYNCLVKTISSLTIIHLILILQILLSIDHLPILTWHLCPVNSPSLRITAFLYSGHSTLRIYFEISNENIFLVLPSITYSVSLPMFPLRMLCIYCVLMYFGIFYIVNPRMANIFSLFPSILPLNNRLLWNSLWILSNFYLLEFL